MRHPEADNLSLEPDGQTFQPLFDEPVLVENETYFNASQERQKGFELLRVRQNLLNQLLLKLNVEAFIDLAVDDPDNLKVLADDLLLNSGTALAQLLMGKDADGNRSKALDIIINYLNKNIERLAMASLKILKRSEENEGGFIDEPFLKQAIQI